MSSRTTNRKIQVKPENADLSNQTEVQGRSSMNTSSPVSANRQQSQKTVGFSPGTQIPKPRTKVKAKERQFLTTIDGKVLVPISAYTTKPELKKQKNC